MKYFWAVIMIFVVAVLALFLVFSKPQTSTTKKVVAKASTKPADYIDKNSKVIMTTQGKIVGQDQYRSIRITVSRDSRIIDILNGYDQSVERSQSFSNTTTSYDVFMRALAHAGYNNTRTTTQTDERGVCPLGNRYIYELDNDSNQVFRTWSSSCGTGTGTFAGSGALIRQLFQAQITGYNSFVSGVQL